MRTIVIPGFSTKNKEWAEEIKKELSGTEIHEWAHWSDLSIKFDAQNEAKMIEDKLGQGSLNIIAKSIGTFVLMHFLKTKMKSINKIILCGLPINDLHKDEIDKYRALADFPTEKVLIIQNSDDEHGGFEEVRRMLSQINPNMKMVEKPGKTHDYPYFEEFKEFLGNN